MAGWPDPAHLQTFVAIAEARSLSEAARRLGLSQPTISDHVRKLEAYAGRRLLNRDTHSKTLTEEGRAMLEFARTILHGNARMRRYFARSAPRRLLRIGAGEDLTAGWLQRAIARFMAGRPEVDLEITVALSRKLTALFDEGALDLAICKQLPGSDRGEQLFRDRVVWAAATPAAVFRDDEAQLVLYPPPSITRLMALGALERAGMAWRIACTSEDLGGLCMAARLGLGMMSHALSLMPTGLSVCAAGSGLPELGEVEFVLLRSNGADRRLAEEFSAAVGDETAAARATGSPT